MTIQAKEMGNYGAINSQKIEIITYKVAKLASDIARSINDKNSKLKH